MTENGHPVAAAYDERAAEYEAVGGRLSQMHPRDVATIRAWRDSTDGALLDAGCGPGHWTAFLAEGARDVRGIDLSREFFASARRTYPGIPFEAGSFHELSIPDAAVGGILAWYSLIHTPPAQVPAVLREFARAPTRWFPARRILRRGAGGAVLARRDDGVLLVDRGARHPARGRGLRGRELRAA
ncbi:class I SAM-dependent methyltransferase [Microbacterium hydrocarbonoxydans]|uniref:class I SAM-dependent methyltransferase n=1 Tax=Microbacterium hydrocarbonoxydans TaxID=273678 RepID=UPI0020420CC2|nr:class I SAM-dependent methyltransferase [Microbacterium hydrocarbonoxydans]MCM3780165.1 class I SAM-dependent methyltransferase [Microbacterium hydrocarbonoxydans]